MLFNFSFIWKWIKQLKSLFVPAKSDEEKFQNHMHELYDPKPKSKSPSLSCGLESREKLSLYEYGVVYYGPNYPIIYTIEKGSHCESYSGKK